MRARILVYTAISALALGLCCCKEWLAAQTDDRIMEERLFDSESGFYTALNGIYIDLLNTNLYTNKLTNTTFDVMAQYYRTDADNHSFRSLAQYQTQAKRDAVAEIWTRAYYLIVSINVILEHCETDRGVLSDTARDTIAGECHALRALLHFELLRIFGPVRSLNPAAAAIPYMDVAEPQVKPILPMNTVVTRILEDLETARRLLEASDPVTEYGKWDEQGGVRNILRYRNLRMNYFAVKALAARVHLYDQNKPEALRYAKEVISQAARFFPFSTREQVNGLATGAEDRILSSDILFAAYNTKRDGDVHDKCFSYTLEVNKLLNMTDNGFNNLYPEQSDLRVCQWQQKRDVLGNDGRFFVKYEEVAAVRDGVFPYMIPVIRMSEMYLIAAECETVASNAYSYLNELRSARRISQVSSALEANIEDEYIREFAGEGQLFWYYKRKYASAIPCLYNRSLPDIRMTEERYLFEIPQTEEGHRD